MEDILGAISKEATGAPRLRNVKEVAAQSQEILIAQKNAPTLVAFELRDKCLHPLRLALESKSHKLSGYSLAGLKTLIADPRFQGDPLQENEEQRLPFQVLQALAITPTLHEDLQVEIMKLLLTVTCSASCPVTALSIIRVAEFCLSVYGSSKQEVHRACQVTLLQIVSILAQNATYYMNQLCMEAFQRSNQPTVRVAAKVTVTQMLGSNNVTIGSADMEKDGEEKLPNGAKSDELEDEKKDALLAEEEIARLAEVPCDAFIRVLSFFCSKLSESRRGSQQTNTSSQPLLTLQLEAILAMVSNAGPELRRSQNFLKVTWQELCPALIAILGIPRDEKRLISHHSMPGLDNEISSQDHGRGSSSTGTTSKHRAANRIIYHIAVELVRLIGSVESLRPVLGSLFHHILLFPPPVQRHEALNVLKEMLCNPERLMDLAGPPVPLFGSEKTPQSKTVKKSRNPDLDILTMLIDGIAEATQCKDGAVCHSSVSCVGALLSALELVARGKGLNDKQAEIILKRAEQEEEERNYIPKSPDKPDVESNGVEAEVPPAKEHEDKEQLEDKDDEDAPSKEVSDNQDVPNNDDATHEDDDKPTSDKTEDVQDTSSQEKEKTSQDGEKNCQEGGKSIEQEEDVIEKDDSSSDTDGEEIKDVPTETNKEIKAVPTETNKEIDNEKAIDSMDQATDNSIEEEEVVIQAKQTVLEHRDSEEDDSDSMDMEYSSGEVAAIIQATAEYRKSHLVASENGSPEQANVGAVGGPEEGNLVHRFRYNEDESSLEEMSPSHQTLDQSAKTISLAEQELLEKQEQRREEIERLAKINEVAERKGAREFSQALIELLPVVIPMISTYEVDEMIQKFSSNFVTNYTKQLQEPPSSPEANSTNDRLNLSPVINADGVYIATYYSLLLNLKLIRTDHYENPGTLPLTKKQFIDSVHDSGVLVYLSSTWLGELFQIVIENNVLGQAGYEARSYHCNKALISLLTDIDGLGSQDIGGQMLHDAHPQNQKLLSMLTKSTAKAGEAGMKCATIILNTYWNQILAVLSVPLSARNLSNAGSIASFLGSESTKGQGSRERDAICLSLDSLRKAAGLSCTLGLQSRCATVFAQIANASCVSEDPFQQQHQQQQAESSKIPLRGRSNKNQGIRLHAAHILSMDSLLSMGLEMGSHSEECWKHVFRCCAYVSQLEHCHFSSGGTTPAVSLTRSSNQQNNGFNQDDMGGDELDMLASYVQVPSSSPAAPCSIDVQEVIRQESRESGFEVGSARGGMLSANSAAKVVFGLSSEVERFFDEAANNLNLHALIAFLRELRKSSQQQLYRGTPSEQDQSIIRPTSPSKSLKTAGQASNSLQLFRMADVILKCVRHSSRPLLHIMQAWNVVAPHFVEAACHKDRHVSKKAVNAIHDVLQELLMGKEELPHFNFHEALFKPFESLLRLELCDEDVQDQVVSSICEMVEASFTNIKSGWRPLFGALRAVRIHRHQPSMKPPSSPAPGGPEIEDSAADRTEHPLAPVFNVFEAFLNTDNVTVFANAAIDCILCLLKFLKGSNDTEFSADSDSSDGDSVSTYDKHQMVDLCFPALNYLHRCHKILASIYAMPALPMFQGAESIKLGARDVSSSSASSSTTSSPIRSPRTPTKQTSTTTINASEDDLFAPVAIDMVDDESGIIRVWFLLLEGLTGAVSMCPRQHQPQTLELLFELLRTVLAVPGCQFAIFAVTELLLPMLHTWVHRSRQTQSIWDPTTGNFKHACGLATDLVVEYITHFVNTETPLMGVYLMLRQLLDVLIECIGTSNESISRLGCSCIRHLLLSAGPVFTHDMWTVACRGMQRAITASLRSIKLLMACFHPGSEEYVGDVCQVKVAARRDATEMDCMRLQQLAQQVFLLESQRTCGLELEIDEDSTRSFIFIIYPPDVDTSTSIENIKSRVPFRNVVLGLLSHQLLIQTLGTIFLYGAENQTSREQNLLTSSSIASTLTRQESLDSSMASEVIDDSLPGLLAYLTPKNLALLLECFVQSYQVACDFNLRPGLKFLLQKVAKFEISVNLYWQAGMSFTFYLHTLLEICNHANGDDLTSDRVKGIVNDLSKRGVSEDDPSVPPSPLGDGVTKRKMSDSAGESISVEGAVSGRRKRSDTVGSTSSTLSRTSSLCKSGLEGMLLNCELSFSPDTQVDHLDWIVKRLHGICNEVCASYIHMHGETYISPKGHGGDNSQGQEQPLFFLVAPKSPASVTQPTEFFGLDFDEEDEDEVDDSDEEGQGKGKGKGKQSNKFASAWTPKVKFNIGCPQEQEVNVMAPSAGTAKKLEKKKEDEKKGKQGPQLYTVATRKTIKSLMQEYKKRKTQHSRSVFVKKPTFKEMMYSKKLQKQEASLTPAERQRRQQIREEQDHSITYDTEAQLNTWSDMILTMLQLLQLLPDSHFTALLPAVFPCLNQLVCHVVDNRVRQGVMEFMDRVAHFYGIV